jgi:hypothetical protein
LGKGKHPDLEIAGMKSHGENTIPKQIEVMLNDNNAEMRDGLHGKKKAPSLTGGKKVRVDFHHRHKYSPKYDKDMRVERGIDQDEDLYVEIVTDPDTGEIVHRCKEPLSQHRDRGSAKPKKHNVRLICSGVVYLLNALDECQVLGVPIAII